MSQTRFGGPIGGGPAGPDARPGRGPSPEPEKKKKILRGVVFERVNKSDGTVEYVSSAPNRKRVVVDISARSGGIIPDTFPIGSDPNARIPYDVLIVRDTEPNDPMSGKYIVKIPQNLSELNGRTDVLTGEVYSSGGSNGGVTNAEPFVPFKHKAEREKRLPLPIHIDERAGTVTILETVLTLSGSAEERKRKMEKFRHFCLDKRTLETAEKVATAIELGEPCLLEGETSTSKTSAIEFLGAVVGKEVTRLNLNGQTDTSELVGKFVPNDGQLQVTFEEALKNPELLSKESLEILEKANKEGRGLTQVESQKIAEREGMKITEWRWQDGCDIRAKKEGNLLILDEINLAEPQILERLNSQLDRRRSITLSENNGLTIRELDDEEMELWKQGKLPGVYPLNMGFILTATMNPAEYYGRAPMSPAFKDRWTSYKNVESPRAEDYTAMMELVVYGEQPEVEIRGTKYKGEDVEPLHQTLGEIGNFRSFLPKLAKFQVKLEELARKRDIGKDKKERYIFTRRGLIEFLGYLENKTVVDRQTGERVSVLDDPKKIILRAIQYYYLDKIANPDDLKKVKDQLDAVGISEDKFTHVFEAPDVKKKSNLTPGAMSRPLEVPLGRLEARKFRGLEGADITSTGKVSSGSFAVGDVLNLKPERANDAARKVRDATHLEVVGFDGAGNVITQITPGLRVIVNTEDNVKSLYDIKEKSTRFPRARVFTNIQGDTIEEMVGEVGAGDWRIGDIVKFKDTEGAAAFAVGAKDAEELKYVGNDKERFMIIQMGDGHVFRISPPRADDVLEKVAPRPENPNPATPANWPKEFVALAGHTIERTDELAMGAFRVGDLLGVKLGVSVVAEVGRAKKSQVVGFTNSGKVIVQLDGGIVTYGEPQEIENVFEKITPAPGAPAGWPKEFKGIGGITLKRTDELERGGHRVGDLLSVRQGIGPANVRDEVLSAKKIEVVGFTSDGYLITQLDSDMVCTFTTKSRELIFEKITPVLGAPANWPKEFARIAGGTIERNDELEAAGYKVGDLLALRPGENPYSREIELAKKLEVVGFVKFDKEGGVIVQVDGDGVDVYTPRGLKQIFEKITPVLGAPAYWPRELRLLSGARINRKDELEHGNFKAGDLLKIKTGLLPREPKEVEQAKKLEVVGFTTKTIVSNDNDVLIQLDGDRVLIYPPGDVEKIFEKATSSKAIAESTWGNDIELNERKSGGGFAVGDEVRLKLSGPDLRKAVSNRLIGREALEAVQRSNLLSVVGFTDNEEIAIGLSDGRAAFLPLGDTRIVFEVVSSGKILETFNGLRVELSGATSGSGFKVADEVRLRDVKVTELARVLTPGEFVELKKSESLEVIGYDKFDNIIIGLRGGKVVVLSGKTAREALEIFVPVPRPADSKGFRTLRGDIIESDGRQELGVLRVGDYLKVESFTTDANLTMADYLVVRGFTDNDEIIVSMGDSPLNKVKVFNQGDFKHLFVVVYAGTKNNPDGHPSL